MDADLTNDLKEATIWVSEIDETIPAPEVFLQVFTSQSSRNAIKYKNREYDELVRKLNTESDGPDRLRLLARAQHQLIEEDIPIIPLFAETVGAWHSSRVKFFDFHSSGKPQLESVTIK
jgi:ABC-type oligopeptide transport system substrate-binding subunit